MNPKCVVSFFSPLFLSLINVSFTYFCFCFWGKITDEAHQLLSVQAQLEKECPPEPPVRLVGLSVNQTITQLLLAGYAKRADRVRAEFKVPDKRCVFSLPSQRRLRG